MLFTDLISSSCPGAALPVGVLQCFLQTSCSAHGSDGQSLLHRQFLPGEGQTEHRDAHHQLLETLPVGM